MVFRAQVYDTKGNESSNCLHEFVLNQVKVVVKLTSVIEGRPRRNEGRRTEGRKGRVFGHRKDDEH